jgi:penicillin amidase
MKVIKFIFSLLLTGVLVFALNTKFAQIPPLGKFLDPFHGFWQNSYTGPENYADFELQGLKDEVTIIYDSLLIPHIFAKNNKDLYFVQGYVTAKERLWQMEITTHASAGRISEIMGPAALDFDRLQRRKGMVFGAKNSMTLIAEHPESSEALESYAAGVNRYIQSIKYKNLGVEYKLLGYEPEEWQPLKTALLFMSMANTLNMAEKDLQNTNFLKLYGFELLNLLYPDYEGVSDPVVDNPGGWDFNPIILDNIPLAIPEGLYESELLPEADPNVGSNNWAVSGKKTQSGHPILCNDPHLELNLPSIWYIIQLNAPGINTMGASLPGAPFVVVGWNDSIAWGETNAQRDLIDYYKITFKDESMDRYLLDDIWVPTQKVIEEIKIKGQESLYDTVIYTNWGPVIYDRSFRPESERKNLAFRWISHDASDPALTFYKLNKAKNYHDYKDALDHYSSPAQNFAFADVNGDIAIRVQGKFPVRRKDEGRFVLDGSKSFNGWKEFIPNEHNIQTLNPERGFVSSANQYPADNTYPYYITASNFEAFRNRRINYILDSLNEITAEDMMRLQNDNFNLEASDALPALLGYLNPFGLDTEEKIIYEILKSWNYYNNPDSEAASYYEIWWTTFEQMLWDELRNAKVSLRYPTDYTTIQLVKDSVQLELYDRQETPESETLAEVIESSFKETITRANKWKAGNGEKIPWAVFKGTTIKHLVQQLEAFHIPVYNGGNGGIVNATSGRNGPSWRMVVSLDPSGVKAWGVYPGGQSGNPGSPFYSNLISYWESGKYYPMLFLNDANANNVSNGSKQTLTPAK